MGILCFATRYTAIPIWNGRLIVIRGFLLSSSFACPCSYKSLKYAIRSALSTIFTLASRALLLSTSPVRRASVACSTKQDLCRLIVDRAMDGCDDCLMFHLPTKERSSIRVVVGGMSTVFQIFHPAQFFKFFIQHIFFQIIYPAQFSNFLTSSVILLGIKYRIQIKESNYRIKYRNKI